MWIIGLWFADEQFSRRGEKGAGGEKSRFPVAHGMTENEKKKKGKIPGRRWFPGMTRGGVNSE